MSEAFSIKTVSKNRYFSSVNEFQFLNNTTIGKGSFGTVVLALHLKTSKIYAIKIIHLEAVTTEVGLKALQRQKSIHSILDHPHIVKLWDIFEENKNIYMVMQYIESGNLFYYQNTKRIFTQAQASIFFSQTLSAIQYLHANNYMHRDLKPENLLLDKDYNLKICDFGWVVEGINQKRKIFCGTYQYMAPQMIFDQPYDYKIDIWALGILLYELLHGFAPFQGETVAEVRQQMLKGEIQIDPEISQQGQDLIYSILKLNPEQRLSLGEIASHQWLRKNEKQKIKNLRSLNSNTIKKKLLQNTKNMKKQAEWANLQKNQVREQQPQILQKAQSHKSKTYKDKFDKSIQDYEIKQRNINKANTTIINSNKNQAATVSITKKVKDKTQIIKNYKDNQFSIRSQKNYQKQNNSLAKKKKTTGIIKGQKSYESTFAKGHRPQNSDITCSYENQMKIKKQCRLKTDQSNNMDLHKNSDSLNKYQINSTKALTRYQTEIGDGFTHNLTKKRQKNMKTDKYKKKYLQNPNNLIKSKDCFKASIERDKQNKLNLNNNNKDCIEKYLRKSLD